jgi:hypothetical protein
MAHGSSQFHGSVVGPAMTGFDSSSGITEHQGSSATMMVRAPSAAPTCNVEVT